METLAGHNMTPDRSRRRRAPMAETANHERKNSYSCSMLYVPLLALGPCSSEGSQKKKHTTYM